MLPRLTRYFLRGLLVLVPLVVTLWILWWVVAGVDRLIDLSPWLGRHIPGLGLVATLGLILLVGFLAGNFATRWLFGITDRIFARLPLVKLLYGALKDLTGAFVGERRRFDRPVIVEAGTPGGLAVIGFQTREELSDLGIEGRVAVYIPQSYNFAGNLIVVPRERVRPLQVDSAIVMAFLISGGVSSGPTGSETPLRSRG